jgi:hypothetical protein
VDSPQAGTGGEVTFYQIYFANVRWVELLLAVGVAVLGDLQVTIGTGGKINQESLLKAATVGLAVGWAYLRMPKVSDAESEEPDTDFANLPSGSLPAGVDATGPSHDVAADIVESAISGLLPPIVAKAAPDLAKNIVGELGRVLRRGIKL